MMQVMEQYWWLFLIGNIVFGICRFLSIALGCSELNSKIRNGQNPPEQEYLDKKWWILLTAWCYYASILCFWIAFIGLLINIIKYCIS
jgi:hypothetical protein